MKPGPKPKPTARKQIEGNPGKRVINPNEPQPPPAMNLEPPRGRLSKHSRRMWKSLAPLLERLGVLTEADLAAFELLCDHYGFAIDAAAILRDEGLVVREVSKADEKGNPIEWRVKKNPAAQIFRENAVAFRMMAAEFGLTPSARARLDVDPPAKTESLFDEFQRLVNGG